MMKITGIGAKTMDIVVGKERDQNPERGSVAIAAPGRRSRKSAPGTAPGTARRSSGTGRAGTPSTGSPSTGSPGAAMTGAGRAPRTGGNKASHPLQPRGIAKLVELYFKISY